MPLTDYLSAPDAVPAMQKRLQLVPPRFSQII